MCWMAVLSAFSFSTVPPAAGGPGLRCRCECESGLLPARGQSPLQGRPRCPGGRERSGPHDTNVRSKSQAGHALGGPAAGCLRRYLLVMTILSDAARRAIEAPRLAHITTLDPDGTPHVTVVWVGLDGDEVVTAHMRDYRKLRNLR